MEEGQDGDFSSGSDTEAAGRGGSKKDKEGSGQNLDIQVKAASPQQLNSQINERNVLYQVKYCHINVLNKY